MKWIRWGAALAAVVAVLPGGVAAHAAPVPESAGIVLPATTGAPTEDLVNADLTGTRTKLEARADFAGMWVADSGRLVVALTGAPTSAQATEVRKATPLGAALEVRAASRTWAQLLDMYQRGTAQMKAYGATEVGVDVVTNTVEVAIDPSSPSDTEARIVGDLGPGVAVVRRAGSASAANDRTSPYPHVRAGLKITTGSKSCTAGIQFVNSLAQFYMLTAGHCGQGSWLEGSSTGPYLGGAHTNRFGDGTSCDCEAIGPLKSGQATNQVYLSPTTNQPMKRTGSLGGNQAACYSGASRPDKPPVCGRVNKYPVSIRYTNYNNWTVTNLAEVRYNKIAPGDSGAPVYSGDTAVGIAVAYSNDYDLWYYTPIQTAMGTMNGYLLTCC